MVLFYTMMTKTRVISFCHKKDVTESLRYYLLLKLLPFVSGVNWTENYAFFKAEGEQINIGLGKGLVLEIFEIFSKAMLFSER